jgi:hypothetical protein
MKPGILLRAEALTATAFQPFGEVMEASPDAGSLPSMMAIPCAFTTWRGWMPARMAA